MAGVFIGLRMVKKKNSGKASEPEEEPARDEEADREKEMREMREFLRARQSCSADEEEDEPEAPAAPSEDLDGEGYMEYTETPSGVLTNDEPEQKRPFGTRM